MHVHIHTYIATYMYSESNQLPTISIFLRQAWEYTRATKALFYVVLCPVGPYFSTGLFKPVSLYCDPTFVRSWPGGIGATKLGA